MTVRDAELLEQTWRDPPGIYGWICAINHKTIARRYIVTAFGFFIAAGILAALMRLQLSRPNMTRLSPQAYNEAFTLHGSTMMFLVAVPIMEAIGLWITPLMLGARNLAFPRLAAFSYWLYLGGILMLWIPHALNTTPDCPTAKR